VAVKRLANSSIAKNRTGRMDPVPPVLASGGTVTTITDDGVQYKLHSFTSTGTSTFTITSAGSDAICEILLIGGGGGGRDGFGPGSRAGAGGGGGGVMLSSFEAIPDTYDVRVGPGVSRQTRWSPTNSTSIKAQNNNLQLGAAPGGSASSDGASGSGQDYRNDQRNQGYPHFGIDRQGFPGAANPTPGYAGGGAGGAATGNTAGIGKTLTFTGTSVTYASGARGGGSATTNPNIGGAGSGSNPPGLAASGTNGALYIRYKI